MPRRYLVKIVCRHLCPYISGTRFPCVVVKHNTREDILNTILSALICRDVVLLRPAFTRKGVP